MEQHILKELIDSISIHSHNILYVDNQTKIELTEIEHSVLQYCDVHLDSKDLNDDSLFPELKKLIISTITKNKKNLSNAPQETNNSVSYKMMSPFLGYTVNPETNNTFSEGLQRRLLKHFEADEKLCYAVILQEMIDRYKPIAECGKIWINKPDKIEIYDVTEKSQKKMARNFKICEEILAQKYPEEKELISKIKNEKHKVKSLKDLASKEAWKVMEVAPPETDEAPIISPAAKIDLQDYKHREDLNKLSIIYNKKEFDTENSENMSKLKQALSEYITKKDNDQSR
jgi:hypothetical protein